MCWQAGYDAWLCIATASTRSGMWTNLRKGCSARLQQLENQVLRCALWRSVLMQSVGFGEPRVTRHFRMGWISFSARISNFCLQGEFRCLYSSVLMLTWMLYMITNQNDVCYAWVSDLKHKIQSWRLKLKLVKLHMGSIDRSVLQGAIGTVGNWIQSSWISNVITKEFFLSLTLHLAVFSTGILLLLRFSKRDMQTGMYKDRHGPLLTARWKVKGSSGQEVT